MKKFYRKALKSPKDWKKILTYLGIGAVGLGLLFTIITVGYIAIVSYDLPDIRDLKNSTFAESSVIYDRNGEALYSIHGDEDRKYVTLSEMSQSIIDATIAIEDDEFYQHKGFDLPGILKALYTNTVSGDIQRGASTITQQLVKNTVLSNEKSYQRKIKELLLAIRVEDTYSKEEILEMYLNKIPYGNNAFGVQRAAEKYFDKDAKDLDLAESAILASLPNAPTRYNPFGSNRYSRLLVDPAELANRNITSEKDLRTEEYIRGLIGTELDINGNKVYIPGRANIVLGEMLEKGNITESEMLEATRKIEQTEDLFKSLGSDFQHPHFVLYIKTLIEEKYGKDYTETGGLKIYTTLDAELQDVAEAAVTEIGESNAANYNATNASLISLDPNNGHILAMVGSRDYDNTDIDGNVNISTNSYRQPGSSFKPFVYAVAFKNGYGPGSVLYDVRTNFGAWTPENYDGTFEGPMSIRQALGASRNIPAVKAYYLAGRTEPVVEQVNQMGLTNISKNTDAGGSLSLGGGITVRPIDLATAYGVFANGGEQVKANPIIKIETSDGTVLEEFEEETEEKEQVLEPEIAYLINDILSDESVKLGPRLSLPGKKVATKTGTSTKPNGRPADTWTVGYTSNVVTVVWAGNSNDAKTGDMAATASGYTNAAPIWQRFMLAATQKYPSSGFSKPSGVVERQISLATGLLPTDRTPEDYIGTDLFAESAETPEEPENTWLDIQIETVSGLIWQDGCPEDTKVSKLYREHHAIDQSYSNWESAIQAWLDFVRQQGEEGEEEIDPLMQAPPTEFCTPASTTQKPKVEILSPDELIKGVNKIEVNAAAPLGIEKVEFFLNDSLKATARSAPYTGTLRIGPNYESGSKHIIEAKITDESGYTASSVIELEIVEEDEPDDSSDKPQIKIPDGIVENLIDNPLE